MIYLRRGDRLPHITKIGGLSDIFGEKDSACTVENSRMFRPVRLGVRAEPTVAGRREKQSPKAHNPGRRPGVVILLR